MLYKIPLLLTPQPEGSFTVTSPLLPELVTEGESIDEVLVNVRDAFEAIRELYDDLGKNYLTICCLPIAIAE
jgi:antitoxin HicB